jgi:predicted RNA-binding protein with PUA-like domain
MTMTRMKPYNPEINYWLLQTEPDQYSWDDLERDNSTIWNGVTDYEALKNLRDIDDVDMAFICHKGDEPAIVGIVRVTSDSYPDPEGNDPTLFAIDVELVGRLPKPIRLNDILDDPEFQDFQLVQEPDLDVMEVPAPIWERLVEMAGAQDVGLIPTGREQA